ncbi:MAG: hypothetical protein AB4426_04730 [Xenococcaceae cyanobacterium]
MTTSLESTLDANSQTPIREIEEIAIAISAKELNPTILTHDFLKFSGIVPKDWELGKQPVLSARLAQLSFQNGVNIVAQPRTISFIETISTKDVEKLKAPEVARKYIEKLPHAEYEGLNISPKSLVPFPQHQDAARRYVTETLLAPGPWQEFGKAPVQAGINLLYQLDRCQLSLSINEANLRQEGKPTIPALLFSSNFNYNFNQYSAHERPRQLGERIDNWKTDLEMFREIIQQWFLKQQESVFPSITESTL